VSKGAKDLANIIIARVISAVMTIVIQGCLAWFLLPAGRGSYAVCLIFSILLAYIFAFGFDIAFSYFVSSKKISLSEAFTYSLFLVPLISFVADITGYIVLHLQFEFTQKATYSSFLLALLYVPVFLFTNIYIQIFTAINQFKYYSLMLVLRELDRLLLILLFILGLSLGVDGALLAIICSDLIIIFSSFLIFKFKYKIQIVKINFGKLKEIFSYGLRYYFGNISNILNFHMGTIILSFFATKVEIGLFSVATVITTRVEMIPDAFFSVIFPRVAASVDGRKELVAQCARISGIICCLILLFLVIFAEPIIKILFSSAFLASKSLIRILAIGIMIRCGCKVFVSYIVGTNHPGIASMSVVFGLIINIILMYILLPLYGLNGAAISVCVNYLLSSFLFLYSFIYLTNTKLLDIIIPQKADFMLLKSVVLDKLNISFSFGK